MSSGFDPIPGETPIDPSELKIKSIKTRDDLLPYEAKNIRKATVKSLSARPGSGLAPFDVGWLLQLHQEMFGDVWQWAGQQRTEDLTLGIPWQNVGEAVAELADTVQAFHKDESQCLEQSVMIHHKAVFIHPFKNGNGRWSRMLANFWLRQQGQPVIEWPNVDLGKRESPIRSEHIEVIKAADDFDYDPLTELHQRFQPES